MNSCNINFYLLHLNMGHCPVTIIVPPICENEVVRLFSADEKHIRRPNSTNILIDQKIKLKGN